jgi:hypothetical protein
MVGYIIDFDRQECTGTDMECDFAGSRPAFMKTVD